MTTLFEYSEADVNAQLAYDAHRGTSFVPERRRDSAVKSYVDHMAWMEETFQQWATEDNLEALKADLENYKQGYIKRLHALWAARSRIVSTMIAGPSGFPTRTMEKRNQTVDRRREEFLDWSEKRRDKLQSRYDPYRIARAPIQSNDPDAIEKLTRKLESAITLQETMKAANRIIRRKSTTKEEKVAALADLGIGATNAHKLLLTDYPGPGFASYSLTNNNAKIKRLKGRIASLEAKKNTEYHDVEIKGVTVHYATDLDRLQLLFPDKPSAEVRTILKRSGFRWAPSQMAWQRQLTGNAVNAAQRVLEDL